MYQMAYVCMANCRENSQCVIKDSINLRLQDELDILDGNCSFNVDYLGCVEISDPTNSGTCQTSFARLYQEYATGICCSNSAKLWITGYELRIVEKNSKILIMAQIIENVIYCATVPDNPDQLFYTCKDTINNRFMCHLFTVKNNLSGRLCRAIGFAFRMCLKRKVIRESVREEFITTNTMRISRSLG